MSETWQVVGHEWAVELLKRSLADGRIAHAYLLLGPPQIGKRTLALNFAQALNCQAQEQDRPCGRCLSCQKIAHGTHPDVRLIEGERGTLKIDQIRAVRREASFSTHEGRWKVYILRQMEQATTEAANCLLKTLEEPPTQVILVLTATTGEALLPTIVSRCQVLSLRPLPVDEVRQALEERWGIAPERAELVAQLSGGRLGWAVEADETTLKQRQTRLAELAEVLTQKRVERQAYANQLSRTSRPDEVLGLWLSWWRDLFLIKVGCPARITNIDHQAFLKSQAETYTLLQIKDCIRDIQAAVQQLDDNVNPRLALEGLMLKLPYQHPLRKST
jgi:DNA polymerase-3 subunit delta'